MTCEEAKLLIKEGSVTIVDIRATEDYKMSHIKDAISLSDDSIEDFLKETDKTVPVICYCYHGISSLNATVFLKEKGFAVVHSLEGGYERWRENL